MDIKNLRFREMEAIGRCMSQEIDHLKAILARYRFLEDNNLEDYVLGFLLKKANDKPVRAYMVWKLHEYLLHGAGVEVGTFKQAIQERPLFSAKLPLVFELVISIQYMHNQILDEKFEARTSNWPKVNATLLQSNMMRELLFIYLEEQVNPLINAEQQTLLYQGVSQALMYVDLGQRIEKEYNTYQVWKSGQYPVLLEDKFLGSDRNRTLMQPFLDEVMEELDFKQDFARLYFHRIYLTNVYLFEVIATTVVNLTPQARGQDQQAVEAFGLLYGFMLQLVNDYADFAYSEDKEEQQKLHTAAKKSTDFMADLYNFNVTLPLIFHLQWKYRRRIEAYLEGGRKRKTDLATYARQIMQEIVDTGGIRKTIALSRTIAKAAVSHLDKTNPAFPYLENMGGMALKNKFYDIFDPPPK